MRNTFFATFTISATMLFAFTFSVPARAASLSLGQVQAIIGLMVSFGADAGTIAQVQASLSGSAAATPQPSCVILSHTLQMGSVDATTNSEVSKLQAYLGGSVTGYFGPATLSLVQEWQASHGVVSSGSPSTTGFGVVGIKTRAMMSCGNSTSYSSTTVSLEPSSNFGISGISSPSSVPTPDTPTQNITGAIDKISATSQTTETVITGRAQGIATVVVTISRLGQKVYDSPPLSTMGGVWSVTIPAVALTPGTYAINVYAGLSTRVIARGSMTISGN